MQGQPERYWRGGLQLDQAMASPLYSRDRDEQGGQGSGCWRTSASTARRQPRPVNLLPPTAGVEAAILQQLQLRQGMARSGGHSHADALRRHRQPSGLAMSCIFRHTGGSECLVFETIFYSAFGQTLQLYPLFSYISSASQFQQPFEDMAALNLWSK